MWKTRIFKMSRSDRFWITIAAATGCLLMLYVVFRSTENERNIPVNAAVSVAKGNQVDISTLEIYRSQAGKRKQMLQAAGPYLSYDIFYNVLVPEVLCTDLVRVGTIGDGGKWICNPARVKQFPECTIYSLGINNDPSFDEDFQNFTAHHCLLRSIDKDNQSVATLERINNANGIFVKALISASTNRTADQYSFKDVLSDLGDQRIDILKIDIEGAEHAIKDQLVSVPICQILIEIHSDAVKMYSLLHFLSTHGFYLFSYEINGYFTTLSEFSFIHQNCFADYGIETIFGKYLS